MKKCLTCGKNIESLNYFIRVDFCSKECENKGDGADMFNKLFGTLNPNK